METGKQHKYICANCGQSGCFSSSFQSSQADIDCVPQKLKIHTQGPFGDFWGPYPAHPISSHTWGDCYNSPKNKTSEGQHSNKCNNESHNECKEYFSPRGQGCGRGSYYVPWLPNPFPISYIQQAPRNVPPDVLSTVTNTDTSSVVPNQTYVIKLMNNNRGEKNSRRLYSNVIYCESVYSNDISCCDTVTDAINVANLALPCANSQSHHFNAHLYLYPQDGVIYGHQPDKDNTFYAIDTECIQEVDNFQIYIDIFQIKANVYAQFSKIFYLYHY